VNRSQKAKLFVLLFPEETDASSKATHSRAARDNRLQVKKVSIPFFELNTARVISGRCAVIFEFAELPLLQYLQSCFRIGQLSIVFVSKKKFIVGIRLSLLNKPFREHRLNIARFVVSLPTHRLKGKCTTSYLKSHPQP
jgi:hypothetical protein